LLYSFSTDELQSSVYSFYVDSSVSPLPSTHIYDGLCTRTRFRVTEILSHRMTVRGVVYDVRTSSGLTISCTREFLNLKHANPMLVTYLTSLAAKKPEYDHGRPCQIEKVWLNLWCFFSLFYFRFMWNIKILLRSNRHFWSSGPSLQKRLRFNH